MISAGGQDIHYTNQLSDITYSHLGLPVALVVSRNNQNLSLSVTPRATWPDNQGPMGIEMRPDIVTNYSWPQAVVRAGQEMVYQFQVLFELPAKILSRQVPLSNRAADWRGRAQ